jgi:hypothetical protein
MVHFREVQHFRQIWLWAILLGSLLLVGFLPGWMTTHSLPPGRQTPSPATLWGPVAIGLALSAWIWLLKLVTEVREDEIMVQFVWMWRARHIPYSTIRSVEAVQYRPIAEYGGWGIRLGAAGWAYNVSGNRGVRIHYTDGKTFLIGSQRAEELAQAIDTRLRLRR